MAFENDDADYLTQFDDTDLSILPSVHTDEIVSLCGVVSSDYSGQKRLMRYADLNSNGYYNVFHRNEDIPLSFTNRNIIFIKMVRLRMAFMVFGLGQQFRMRKIPLRIIYCRDTTQI